MSQKRRAAGQKETMVDSDSIVPISQELSERLYAFLGEFFPRAEPLSVLLLHVSQLEQAHLAAHKRRRFRAPASLLEQVLTNVQRVIRCDDRILIQEGVGAAIILPDVDSLGAYGILERVYDSVSLLQAETVVPPLTRETSILMGISSYPEPASSLEMLLYHAKSVARNFTLRPAITTQLRGVKPVPMQEIGCTLSNGTEQHDKKHPGVPFMELPKVLPLRLAQIIPYALARELRCVPVGRDHQCLTVAMADPSNDDNVRRLRETTGMLIFPVSCEEKDLDLLLVELQPPNGKGER